MPFDDKTIQDIVTEYFSISQTRLKHSEVTADEVDFFAAQTLSGCNSWDDVINKYPKSKYLKDIIIKKRFEYKLKEILNK